MDRLIDLPDQPPPAGATCVADLLPLVGDHQRVTFCGPDQLSGDQPSFLKISEMGGYLNHGLPQLVHRLEPLEWPTPDRGSFAYQPLSSLGEPTIEFNGNAEWISDFYHLGGALFLISDKLLGLLTERDSAKLEVSRARIVGERAGKIEPYWVAMPTRVLDAVDISKSCVTLKRPEILPGLRQFVTLVSYRKGYVFREDLPADARTFVDEFTGRWFWRTDLIEAAAELGARGLHFGFGQVELQQEIKLRGLNDPSNW